MNKKELRSKLIAEMRELSDKAKAETRSFNDEEGKLYAEKEAEVRKLTSEIEAEERELELNGFSSEKPVVQEDNNMDARSNNFAATGKTEMRSVLASGNIAKPTKADGVNGLGEVADSIVDDVHAIALTGYGAWVAAYKSAEAIARATTDGQKVGKINQSTESSGATFNYVTINPAEWGILDEISNQVKKMTPVDYETAVKNSALIALRTVAASKIISALAASSLVQNKTYALDKDYIRSLVLGFRSIAGKGNVKLYISQGDLATLGQVRGTNEKKAVFDITFDAGTTTAGIIKDGGTAVAFRVLDGLSDGTQYFGQPLTIDMPMWDNYQIATDEGGDYFARNVMGIRGIQTANADLVAKYGMQKVANSSST